MWRGFRERVLELGEEVCGTRRIREGIRRKRSEWWSGEIRKVVEKKGCFLIWRRTKSDKDWEDYKRIKMVVERMVGGRT